MQTTVILNTLPSFHPSSTAMSAAGTPPTQMSTAWGGSPWGKVSTPACPLSLKDVMSEELAEQLQQQEQEEHMTDLDKLQGDLPVDLRNDHVSTDETTDDLLLAQMLQKQFDKEHDAFLDKEEAKWNGDSKLQISFKNYKTVHPYEEDDDAEEEEEDDEDWEEEKNEPLPKFNKSGVSGKGANMISKHDSNISARRNADRVMEKFPPEFETGDGSRIQMRLPNHVYNKLKRHSAQETKRSQRVHDKKEHSTTEMAVDAKTRLILYKLVSRGILESIEGVVASGKEAIVFHGTGGSNTEALVPEECAIKVFKTTLSEFKNRCDYIRGDNRFMKDEFKKQNPRKIIKIWAEKEMANLKKMESCGIACPKAIILKRHVLVMEFLGAKQVPAPKIRDAGLTKEEAEWAYKDTVEAMTKLHRKAGLVHADLSEFNMLWHNSKVYFIDVAQGVEVMHPRAMEFLMRDCENVCKFFKNIGVRGVKKPQDLFNQITCLELRGEGKEFLAQVHRFEKNEDKIRHEQGKEYSFNYFFEKSQNEKEEKKKKEELFEDSASEEDEDEEEVDDDDDEKVDPEFAEKLQVILENAEAADTYSDKITEETAPDPQLVESDDH